MKSIPRPLREISPIMADLVEEDGWIMLHSSSVGIFAGDALIEKDGVRMHYGWVKSDRDFVVSLSEASHPRLDQRHRQANLIEVLHALGFSADRNQEALASAAQHLPDIKRHLLSRGGRKLPAPFRTAIICLTLGLAFILIRQLAP